VLAAGVNLCWIGMVWPMLVRGAPTAVDTVALAGALLLLGGGALAVGRRTSLAAGALLVGLPVTLGVGLTSQPEALIERAFGPLPSAVLLLSFGAFGALSAQAISPTLVPLQVRCTPINEAPAARPARRLHDAIVAMSIAGAVVLSAVAPLWGGGAALRAAWGEAAAEAGVLSAVLGSALAVAVLSVFGGAALRPPKRPLVEPDRDAQLASYLFLALLGAVTYFVIEG
jgi:hypothetical protein